MATRSLRALISDTRIPTVTISLTSFLVVALDDLVRLVEAMQDVTERQWAEERLRESEHRFRSHFGSMDEGYCVVETMLDDEGRPADYWYLMVSPALEEHTGMVDIVGKNAREVMPNYESY